MNNFKFLMQKIEANVLSVYIIIRQKFNFDIQFRPIVRQRGGYLCLSLGFYCYYTTERIIAILSLKSCPKFDGSLII